MAYSLLSFLRRRIQIDVAPTDIVLDIGSGDKPHWRADLLLEKFPSASFAHQRSSGGAAVVDRWLVVGDVEDMPFRDKAIDYAICSHLLEHVLRPDKAIQELQRVAKRGYIETPFEGAQKLDDFPSHLWYVQLEDEKLVFTAKQSREFDPNIDILMRTMIKYGIWGKFHRRFFDHCIIEKHWRDQIPYEIRGELSKQFIHEVSLINAKPHDGVNMYEKTLRYILFLIIRSLYKIPYNTSRIKIVNLLRCRGCGGNDFVSISEGYKCVHCQEIITILSSPGNDN